MDRLMFLGFYSVENKSYYSRCSFVNCTGVEIYRMLIGLPEEERKIYLMTEREWVQSDAKEFQCDYNDGLLDGEQWCKVFYMTKDEYKQLLLEFCEEKNA